MSSSSTAQELKKERKKRPRLTDTASPGKTKKSRAEFKAEEEAKALPTWEATVDEDIDYPLDLPTVSQIDLLCFEVDEEVFEETKKKIVHMTEEEIDKYIKSFFKYSCYRPQLQKKKSQTRFTQPWFRIYWKPQKSQGL